MYALDAGCETELRLLDFFVFAGILLFGLVLTDGRRRDLLFLCLMLLELDDALLSLASDDVSATLLRRTGAFCGDLLSLLGSTEVLMRRPCGYMRTSSGG